MTSQSVMSVDGEEIPGKAVEKRWCLSLFLKADMNEWMSSYHADVGCCHWKLKFFENLRNRKGDGRYEDGWWHELDYEDRAVVLSTDPADIYMSCNLCVRLRRWWHLMMVMAQNCQNVGAIVEQFEVQMHRDLSCSKWCTIVWIRQRVSCCATWMNLLSKFCRSYSWTNSVKPGCIIFAPGCILGYIIYIKTSAVYPHSWKFMPSPTQFLSQLDPT